MCQAVPALSVERGGAGSIENGKHGRCRSDGSPLDSIGYIRHEKFRGSPLKSGKSSKTTGPAESGQGENPNFRSSASLQASDGHSSTISIKASIHDIVTY